MPQCPHINLSPSSFNGDGDFKQTNYYYYFLSPSFSGSMSPPPFIITHQCGQMLEMRFIEVVEQSFGLGQHRASAVLSCVDAWTFFYYSLNHGRLHCFCNNNNNNNNNKNSEVFFFVFF